MGRHFNLNSLSSTCLWGFSPAHRVRMSLICSSQNGVTGTYFPSNDRFLAFLLPMPIPATWNTRQTGTDESWLRINAAIEKWSSRWCFLSATPWILNNTVPQLMLANPCTTLFQDKYSVVYTVSHSLDQFPAIISCIFQNRNSWPSITHYSPKSHRCLIITQPNPPTHLPKFPMPPKPIAGLRICIKKLTAFSGVLPILIIRHLEL